MTTVECFKRYVSSSNAGEYWRAAKTIERTGEEAIKGRPDAAGGQGLRRGGLGRGVWRGKPCTHGSGCSM